MARHLGGSPLSHAGRPHIASVLVQNHPDDLPALVAFEVELRVDNLVKELVLDAREDWDGRLPCELRFEMIAMDRDIEYGTEIEAVFTNVIVERGGVERDCLTLGRKLRRAQFRGRTVAVLVQHKPIYDAIGIAREADADACNPGKKLIGCRRENREGRLSSCLGEKPVVQTEDIEQEFVGKLERSHVFVERRAGEVYRPKCGCQGRVRIERGKTQVVGIRGRVAEDDDAPLPVGRETEKAL